MANPTLRLKKTRPAQFALRIKRNVYLLIDPGGGLTLGHMAVATRPGCPPIRGKVEAASQRSVVMFLRGEKRLRLSRSVWRVGPVVATQYMRDI
jgi:hypothetical protein